MYESHTKKVDRLLANLFIQDSTIWLMVLATLISTSMIVIWYKGGFIPAPELTLVHGKGITTVYYIFSLLLSVLTSL